MAAAQSTSSVFMVRPTTFGFDQETAVSNTFQNKPTLAKDEVRKRAIAEFDAAVAVLRQHDIDVTVFEDESSVEKPDAVFPNNWLSMWPDGTLYLYPMATKSRRVERSPRAVELLKNKFAVKSVIDFSSKEAEGIFLESTGVMIFDHQAKIVYGCLSVRCDMTLFNEHATQLGYKPIVVEAFDQDGVPIYHTNVLMGVQSSTAVVCLDAISNEQERQALTTSLEQTGHTIIAITHEQMNMFCGNVLELQSKSGELFLAMSQTAYDAFTPHQREQLSKDKTLLPLSIPTIETIGGGSVRCMLAEVFLPKR